VPGSTGTRPRSQIALIAHCLSSKPTNLILDDLAGSTEQIFISDVTGALGVVQQPIAAVPKRPFKNPPFRCVDASLNYPVKLKFVSNTARLELVIAFYNVANLGNYSDPSGVLINITDAGASNYVNGPYRFLVKNENRTTRGSGTFDQGGPRSTEFQLKLIF